MTTNTRKAFHPKKYYQGLSARKKTLRQKEIKKYGALSWKDPKAYKGFKTDIGVKTKPSGYTQKWKSMFPNATSLEQKAAATGVPLPYIQQSYDRGLAAWRTGHRPGATQQQWGYARVHSLLLCGKTYYTADSDIVKHASENSFAAKQWWAKKKC